jgi:hypothetical protein
MTNNFAFKIREWLFSIKDLGPQMNQQYQNIYDYYISGKGLELGKLEDETIKFLDKNKKVTDHDDYFNNFTPLWQFLLQQGLLLYAEQVWEIAVNATKKWEQRNTDQKIHKGAGYYFWAVTCIYKEDLEKGFLLMHEALEEDKRNLTPNSSNTPAHAFVILNFDEQHQFFRNKILEVARFAEQKITNYRASRNGKLTLDEFKIKILQNPDLIEQVFLFVFELFHLKKILAENKRGLTLSAYGSMLMVQSIFTFNLLIDNIIKYKYNIEDPHKQNFIDLLTFLSKKANLELDKSKLRWINKLFTNNFQDTLQRLINSRSLFGTTKLQTIEEDIAIIYGFRNSVAHKIRYRPYIHADFNSIVDRLFNVFFLSVEILY